jgi:hypothetical protein
MNREGILIPNKTLLRKDNQNKDNYLKVMKKEKSIQTIDNKISAYLYSNMLTDVNQKIRSIFKK